MIAVDWRKGCETPNYIQAIGNSALVGRQISNMLQTLIRHFPSSVEPSGVHVIGFSLGAQVSGFCGRHFENATGQRLGRITGKS